MRKIIKWISINPYWCFLITIISFVVVFIIIQDFDLLDLEKNENGEIISHNLIKYTFLKIRNTNFQVFLGIFLSFLGALITVIVYRKVDKNSISTIEDLLDLFASILKRAKKGDKILIIAPTIFLGGSLENSKVQRTFLKRFLNKLKNRNKKDTKIQKRFISEFIKKLKLNGESKEIKIKIAALGFNFDLVDKYNDLENDSSKVHHFENENCFKDHLLIDFHNKIIKEKEIKDKLEYINSLFKFMSNINDAENVEYVNMPDFGESNILAVIKIGNNGGDPLALISTWDMFEPKPSGRIIDESGAIDTLYEMFDSYVTKKSEEFNLLKNNYKKKLDGAQK